MPFVREIMYNKSMTRPKGRPRTAQEAMNAVLGGNLRGIILGMVGRMTYPAIAEALFRMTGVSVTGATVRNWSREYQQHRP